MDAYTLIAQTNASLKLEYLKWNQWYVKKEKIDETEV